MSILSDYWLICVLAAIAASLFAFSRFSELAGYILHRYLMSLVSLFLVSVLVFFLMEILPGDCATRIMAYKNTQGTTITQADIDAERRLRGLDEPVTVRWATWVTNLTLRGDLGFSCARRQPVELALGNRFWVSLLFCLVGLLLAYGIAVPLGIFSAYLLKESASRGRVGAAFAARFRTGAVRVLGQTLDWLLRLISYLGLALPNFLLALFIILLYVFAGEPTPTGLFSNEWRDVPWFADGRFQTGKLWDFLGHIWLPIFVIGWAATALQLQTVRALVIDEASKLYVDAARARGLSGTTLWARYPVRHSIAPLFNSIGFDFTRIFNDLPIVAVVLALTDAAALLIEALAYTNDQELAAAILFLVALVVVLFNFITDVVLAIVDPRVRRSVLGQ